MLSAARAEPRRSPKNVQFVPGTRYYSPGSFKALVYGTKIGTALRRMSLRKSVPEGLKAQDVEKGVVIQAPIPYVPVRDSLQDQLDLKNSTVKCELPNGVETAMVIWTGHGNSEAFVNHCVSAVGTLEDMGLKQDFDKAVLTAKKAEKVLEKAEKKVDDAELHLKMVEEAKLGAADVTTAKKAVAEAKASRDSARSKHEESKGKPAEHARKAFDLYGTFLSQEAREVWNKIVKEHTEDLPHVDLRGQSHAVTPGKTWKSLKDCVIRHLKTEFAHDAAESQKYYMTHNLRKSQKVKVRHFSERIQTLNRYIGYLPSLYNSPNAVSTTELEKPLKEAELAQLLLSMCPRKWGLKYKLTQKTVPTSVSSLVEVLETIEDSEALDKPKPVQPKEGSGKRKGMQSYNDRIPKKAKSNPKRLCRYCDKWGGKPLTHDTANCARYNPDGTTKSSYGKGAAKGSSGSERVSRKDKANFAQMAKKFAKLEKSHRELKDRHKKLHKRFKKGYDSDGSDSS